MSVADFNDNSPFSARANSAVTEYLFVSIHSSSAKSNLRCDITGLNGRSAGIAMETVADEGLVGIANKGRGKLRVDGSGTAITPGMKLKSSAAGKGIAVSANNDEVCAIALEPSSALDDIIAVNIVCFQHGA